METTDRARTLATAGGFGAILIWSLPITVVSCLYFAIVPGPSLWLGCGMLVAGSLLSWYSLADEVSVRKE